MSEVMKEILIGIKENIVRVEEVTARYELEQVFNAVQNPNLKIIEDYFKESKQ